MCKLGFFLFCFVLFLTFPSIAQTLPESKNGKTLPVTGTLRILLIYAEINYDVSLQKEAEWPVGREWQKRELPKWKDEMLDPFPNPINSTGSLTKFYKECSFDSFVVLGDYVSSMVTINESDIKTVSWGSALNKVLEKISKGGSLKTSQNLTVEDFDKWTITSDGLPKISPSIDSPHKYDHIMFIFRNLPDIGEHSGMASPGGPGSLLGFQSDTYSIFRTSNSLPFDIAKHEFSHLLIGDNNFHSGGGQHRRGGANYFIPTLGGWGLLGGGNSSLLTCNAWDRDRLHWVGPNKTRTISAINLQGGEVNTDLDATKTTDAGIYILRDFVTSGDALRIKLPFLSDKEFPQWIWIENHQTVKNNKSSFDKFHFQGNSCVDDATPGLYMYLQVDKNKKQGKNMYGGSADFLRPITAEGFFDYTFLDTTQNNCINSAWLTIFEKETHLQNPFTGNQDQEFPVRDANGDGFISSNESVLLNIEKVGLDTIRNIPNLGDKRDAFTIKGKRKIGIGTNPSTASMMTLVSDNQISGGVYSSNGEGLPNNRKIMLNGISIEIMEEMPDGSIMLKVLFNDVEVSENVRWCADTIVVPPKLPGAMYSLNILPGITVTLDQGLTPTRIINPSLFKGSKIFARPTSFICSDSSFLHMEPGSHLVVDNGSGLHLQANSKVELAKNAEIIVERGAKLKVDKGAQLIIKKGAKVLIKTTGSVEFAPNTVVVEKGGRFRIQKK